MFFDRFEELCRMKGVSCKQAAIDNGLDGSSPSQWKKRGSMPKPENLATLSDYFGVSVLYLIGLEEKENDQHAMSEVDRELFNLISTLSDEEKRKMIKMVDIVKE